MIGHEDRHEHLAVLFELHAHGHADVDVLGRWLALHARRHVHLYGTTEEQLGLLALNSRRNAALNPRAAYRDPLTMDDCLSARMISDPFGLLDCEGRTDLKPGDVDLAELYDGFTYLTVPWLEALGFCGDGEAGPFIEGAARIALDGQLPLNTYGGQLSAGRMHGNWVLHEACLQLRGEAGERQVEKRDVAVVSNGGGPIAGCMLLTR